METKGSILHLLATLDETPSEQCDCAEIESAVLQQIPVPILSFRSAQRIKVGGLYISCPDGTSNQVEMSVSAFSFEVGRNWLIRRAIIFLYF